MCLYVSMWTCVCVCEARDCYKLFFLLDIFIFIVCVWVFFLHVYMYNVCTNMWVPGPHRGKNRMADLLRLELWVAVKAKLWTFGRAANAFSYLPVSLAPSSIILIVLHLIFEIGEFTNLARRSAQQASGTFYGDLNLGPHICRV